MRKEIIFAILAGGLFGLVIAFGIWRANKSLSPEGEVSTEYSQTPAPQTVEDIKIAIAEPKSYDVVIQDTVAVSAVTKPLSWVLASGQDKDYITKSDERGEVNIEVDLTGGINEITLFAFDDTGISISESVLVVYSSEFPLEEGSGVSFQSPTPASTDAVREKVQEKINQASNSPVAYIGTITDMLDTTIQMSKLVIGKTGDDSGDILQVSVDEVLTDFVNTVDSAKTINKSDLAIGDFIIAMGYKNGNSVLNAKRIVVTSAYKSPDLTANLVNVTKISSSGLDGIDLASSDHSFLFDKYTEIYQLLEGEIKTIKYDSIEESVLVGVVGASSQDSITARSVFILETPEEE